MFSMQATNINMVNGNWAAKNKDGRRDGYDPLLDNKM